MTGDRAEEAGLEDLVGVDGAVCADDVLVEDEEVLVLTVDLNARCVGRGVGVCCDGGELVAAILRACQVECGDGASVG